MDSLEKTILHNGNCVIGGSYVYKHLLRGDQFEDVDCICWNVQSMESILCKKYPNYYVPDKRQYYYTWEGNCELKVPIGGTKVVVDVINRESFEREARGPKSSFINSLVLTRNGIEHIDGDKRQQTFIDDNLRKKSYCPWSNMRQKDKEYFTKWTRISPAECKKYDF